MKRKYIFLFFLGAMGLFSCSQENFETMREEGTSLSKAMVKELKKIRSRDELMDQAPYITEWYKKYWRLIERADNFIARHPGVEVPSFTRQDQETSDELRGEFNRLFLIDGCREILENCQKAARNP